MLGREEIDGLQLQLEGFHQSDQKKLDVIHVIADSTFCDVMSLICLTLFSDFSRNTRS